MVRVGMRPWLSFLLVGAGAAACAHMFAHSAGAFYALRVSLGVLQAGVMPACWHIVSTFFPDSMTTKPVSGIFGW